MSRYFSEKEVREAVWNNEIKREFGDNRRWVRSVTSIVEMEDGKHYALDWDEGLTEYQDNLYYSGNYPEVEKRTYEKTITVTEWVKVDKKQVKFG